MLTIAVVILATITSFCQPGFSVDERIDISKNVLINYYNQHSNDPVKKYLTDYAGSNLTQSYLFRDIDLSTYELFVANFSFSDKDQVQKINFQPFKLLNSNNGFVKALGNFKINIVQKKDITTFGLGIGGDNSSPWSKKSKKLMAVHFNTIAAPPPPKTFDNSIYVKQHTAIENEVEQKKLTPETAIILHTIVDESEKQARTKAKQEYMKELEKFDEVVLDQALLNFDLARVKHVFKWTLGYNSQFFTILGAKGNVNNFDSLNFYSNKAGVIGATASYSYNNGWLSISGGYNSIDSRKNAAKTVNKVKYTGASFSLNKRVIKFLKDDNVGSPKVRPISLELT